MNNIFRSILIIPAAFIIYSCTRENATPPVVTLIITDISWTNAIAKVSVTSDGGAKVTAKGICWNSIGNPTTSDNITSDGIGVEEFTTSITQLIPDTKYYIRAYAINNEGTGYSREIAITSNSVSLPQLTTTEVTSISATSAVSGGNILADSGAEITSRGVCWNKEGYPTIDDNKTIDGSGMGSFTSNLTGLITNTKYYVRAYAINSAGTSYGAVQSFSTYAYTTVGQITDIDNNIYTTIAIGNQIWMKENLNVTRYNNGDPIPNIIDDNEWWNLTSGAYCDYDNNPINSITYGRLYNWYTATDSRNLCPSGWHVPSNSELEELITYLGGDSIAGGKLKEQGTSHWFSPNTGATNLSGFTALPAGFRVRAGIDSEYFSEYSFMGTYAIYWTTTTDAISSAAVSWTLGFVYNNISAYSYWKFMSHSVRCLKDN